MKGMAEATLAGNLTRDPELRTTPNGRSVCTVGVAVNERQKRGEEWVDVVNYFDVTVWGQQAEYVAKYFRKGAPVVVGGTLQQRRWEAADGTKREKVEVKARYIQTMGKSDDDRGEAPRRSEPEPRRFDDEDDIPF